MKLSKFLLVLKEEIKILKMGLERMLLESLIKSLDFKVAINIRYLSKRHNGSKLFSGTLVWLCFDSIRIERHHTQRRNNVTRTTDSLNWSDVIGIKG